MHDTYKPLPGVAKDRDIWDISAPLTWASLSLRRRSSSEKMWVCSRPRRFSGRWPLFGCWILDLVTKLEKRKINKTIWSIKIWNSKKTGFFHEKRTKFAKTLRKCTTSLIYFGILQCSNDADFKCNGNAEVRSVALNTFQRWEPCPMLHQSASSNMDIFMFFFENYHNLQDGPFRNRDSKPITQCVIPNFRHA